MHTFSQNSLHLPADLKDSQEWYSPSFWSITSPRKCAGSCVRRVNALMLWFFLFLGPLQEGSLLWQMRKSLGISIAAIESSLISGFLSNYSLLTWFIYWYWRKSSLNDCVFTAVIFFEGCNCLVNQIMHHRHVHFVQQIGTGLYF